MCDIQKITQKENAIVLGRWERRKQAFQDQFSKKVNSNMGQADLLQKFEVISQPKTNHESITV